MNRNEEITKAVEAAKRFAATLPEGFKWRLVTNRFEEDHSLYIKVFYNKGEKGLSKTVPDNFEGYKVDLECVSKSQADKILDKRSETIADFGRCGGR